MFGGKNWRETEMLTVGVDREWRTLGITTGFQPFAVTINNEIYMIGIYVCVGHNTILTLIFNANRWGQLWNQEDNIATMEQGLLKLDRDPGPWVLQILLP